MIDYIKGILSELTPTLAVIEAAGVGYAINIALPAYSALVGKEQQECRLYTTEIIREDTHDLYGFATREERTLFEALTSVNGIGGQTARMVLSAFSTQELAGIIQNEQVGMLKSVKGIGPKAAARIVLDLKDKVGQLIAGGALDVTAAQGGGIAPADREQAEEAIGALTILGFQPANVRKAVAAILKEQPGMAVQQIIKSALKVLK